MKHIDPSPDHLSGNDWRIVGKLELPVGPEADGMLSAWLAEILHPLSLHTDFLYKVLKSAQDAAARSIPAETIMAFEHIHILVFAPGENAPKGKSWGFFRIEKVGTPITNKNPYDHSIEFYIYPER